MYSIFKKSWCIMSCDFTDLIKCRRRSTLSTYLALFWGRKYKSTQNKKVMIAGNSFHH